MIEINLVPDVKQELLKAQRARAVVISASIITSIIAVGLVVVLAFYIYAVQGVRSSVLDGQIETKGEQLTSIEDLSQTLTIQNQLGTISELNKQKNMTSRVFDAMAAITPTSGSSVKYSNIILTPSEDGTGGVIQLEGQTASYDTMELFKKTIANTSIQYVKNGEAILVPLASNISTKDISYGEDANSNKVLRFTISFQYPVELFTTDIADSDISYKQNVNGNVTDSYLGIPQFTQRASDLEGGN